VEKVNTICLTFATKRNLLIV